MWCCLFQRSIPWRCSIRWHSPVNIHCVVRLCLCRSVRMVLLVMAQRTSGTWCLNLAVDICG